jgi:hypothetical protein
MRATKFGIPVRFAFCLTIALLAGIQPAFVRSDGNTDPARYLLPPEDMPAGFEPQPQRDREVDDPTLGVTRAFRLYTHGLPDVPTEEHASIMLAAAISDAPDHASADFDETVSSWSRMGYALSPVGNAVGEEAVAGSHMLFEGTDHPKQAVLVLFHLGMVNAAVQWTDQPGEVTVDHAVAIARRMELRIAA